MSDYANDWVGQTLSGGRYRVDAKLGEGGMGFVYKVWDRNLDADVVVKAPKKSMLDDPEFASRFALEIRSLVKLSHPNIVKVSDVGEHDGLPFAVMQYLDGGTLDERLDYGRNGKPMPAPPASVAGWLPGMAAALDFIHGMGYIHRDVKPANILFDSHGHPYLSDFGVAKVLSDVEGSKKGPSGMTGIGIVLGTPEYMAPELIMGNTFDGKVDQYALAATVYEILCGRKPFQGETATAILVRQTTEAPPPMAELPASVSQAVTRVIHTGLAKKPEGRYSTCVEFADAMMAAIAMAKSAPPLPPVDRVVCPSCGVSFAAPPNLANLKGKKSTCQSCGAPFRVAMDGRSLVKVDTEGVATPSGGIEIDVDGAPASAPRANRTTKLDAMPAPSPARAQGTMKLDAMPAPSRSQGTMKLEAMPHAGQDGLAPQPRRQGTRKLSTMPSAAVEVDDSLDEPPAGRSPLPWIIGGVGVAAALLIVAVILATRPSGEPAIVIAAATNPLPAKITPPKPPPRPQPVQVSTPVAPRTDRPPVRVPTPVVETPVPTPPPMPAAPVEDEKPAAAQSPDMAEREVPPEPVRRDDAPRKVPRKAKGPRSLKDIVGDPEAHLDEVVSPTELLLVSSMVGNGPGPANGLAVRNPEGSYQAFQKAGGDFQIVLNPDLANHLRQQVQNNVIVRGDYPAILKMKIEKGPGNNSYRGVVEFLEFLYYVDARLLESRALSKAIFVLSLTPEGHSLRYSPMHKEWETKLAPTHLIPNVRNTYVKEDRPLAVYKDLANKATHPDWQTAPVFHKWLKAHIHQIH